MGYFNQIMCTTMVCYLCTTVGLMFAWPSSTLKLFSSHNTPLARPMYEPELSLLGSLSSIGALISTPCAGYLLDILGRKYCAILTALTHVISWTLIVACDQFEIILVAIFIAGIGGAAFLIVPVYVSEICQESIRGTMTSGTMVCYGLGLLTSYLLGGCLNYQTMIYVGLSMAIFGILILGYLKESPVFLLQKGLEEEAIKAVAFYKMESVNSRKVRREIDIIKRSLNPDNEGSPEKEKLTPEGKRNKEKLSLRMFIKNSRTTRRAILITFILSTTVTFQGLVVVQVYAGPLFEGAVPNMSATFCSILLAVVMVVASLIAAYLMDVAGRKPLMVYSSMGSGLCCILLGSQIRYHWSPHFLTAVLLYLYCILYTCGAGTVPYVYIAEVFLPEVKSFMSMVIIEWLWLCNFIILLIFHPLVALIGLSYIFYLFAFICFITSVFCLFFLPETKGLAIDEIQNLFDSKHGPIPKE